MKSPFALLSILVVSLVGGAGLVGCAAPSESEDASTSSQSALEESWNGATPTVFAIEKPLDLTLDWSALEVQDPLDPDHAWRPANTVIRPTVSDRPDEGSSVVRELRHGFGSGPCRPRANPFRREIGIMCKWTF